MAINTTINIFILFIYSSCNQQKSNMAVAHLGDARDLAVGQLRQDPALLRDGHMEMEDVNRWCLMISKCVVNVQYIYMFIK